MVLFFKKEPLAPRASGNPIHALLDKISLPWREPRATLAARFGVRPDPAYEWHVIEIATSPPIVDGMIRPLSAQAFPKFSPRLPATRFTATTWFGDDARENLRRTSEQLAQPLGHTEIADRYNTVQCEWTSGAPTIRLMVWPPDMQSGHLNNPAHQRDPRLATGCHLTIETGFRPPPTPAELGWLDSFVPLGIARGNRRLSAEDLRSTSPSESELEFVRAPPVNLDRLFGQFGMSADRRALIFCHTQLYVVPARDVVGLRAERTLPAKGGGGSRLEVTCLTHDEAVPQKRLTLTCADGPDDLNAVGADLAAALNKPFELGAYCYDD